MPEDAGNDSLSPINLRPDDSGDRAQRLSRCCTVPLFRESRRRVAWPRHLCGHAAECRIIIRNGEHNDHVVLARESRPPYQNPRRKSVSQLERPPRVSRSGTRRNRLGVCPGLTPLSFSPSSARRAHDSCQGLQVPGGQAPSFLSPSPPPGGRTTVASDFPAPAELSIRDRLPRPVPGAAANASPQPVTQTPSQPKPRPQL
jgi:hypothetical protein